jgi:hypothetical protein
MEENNVSEKAITSTTIQKKSIWVLTPLFGILLYTLLYFTASIFYPGGSQFDKYSIGFSWTKNYWCNLFNENAINGQPNPARPIALISLVVLGLTLIVFWWLFPKQANLKKRTRLLIQISGFASMVTGFFLFTSFHDTVINVSSAFGLIALAGTFIGLYKLRWKKLLWMGVINILLIATNNILYSDPELIHFLPVVQKISFAFFLIWICLISIKLYQRQSIKPTRVFP